MSEDEDEDDSSSEEDDERSDIEERPDELLTSQASDDDELKLAEELASWAKPGTTVATTVPATSKAAEAAMNLIILISMKD